MTAAYIDNERLSAGGSGRLKFAHARPISDPPGFLPLEPLVRCFVRSDFT